MRDLANAAMGIALLAISAAPIHAQTITAYAGDGTSGFGGDGGPAVAARLNAPQRLAADSAGNLYVADAANNRIRRIDAATGVITTVAGTGTGGFSGDGGPATDAALFSPQTVAIDGAGNIVIADTENLRIRRVDAASGRIDTIAGNGNFDPDNGSAGDGGPATDAPLGALHGVAVDGQGNIFIADTNHCRVRRVDAGTGIIATVAGTICADTGGDGGPATQAAFSEPFDVALDADGNLIIVDAFQSRIRRVDRTTGTIAIIAGNGRQGSDGDGGPATAATLSFPGQVGFDPAGNMHIVDAARIRRVDRTTGIITTVAGTGVHASGGDGGPAIAADVAPSGIAFAPGAYYIAEAGSNRVRKVTLPGGALALVAVKSRKQHGAAGVFDLPVDPAQALAGPVTVEPRAIGAGHAIVFQFSDSVTSLTGATAVDAGAQAVGTVQTFIDGSELTVLLQGVPDNQRLTVSVNGVNGALDASASLGFLVGDVNNTRSVNSSDISGVKARSGQPADATNFRFDLNASGNVNASDISAVKARSGLALP